MIKFFTFRKNLALIFAQTLFFVFIFYLAVASTTDGTINSVNKYAWSSGIGWINFGATQGNVHITNSNLTGYVWSINYGWINLNPTQAGVHNDVNGNLSGYAWGENTGFINFSGVVINSSGKFTGSASGNIVGTINFDCANCSIITDWRPQQTASTTPTDSQISGGRVRSEYFTVVAPKVPAKEITFLERINEFIKSIFPGPAFPAPAVSESESIVPKIAPIAMRGEWKLLPVNNINKFLFAPLPSNITVLTEKFPSLKKTFDETGILKYADLLKLQGVQLTLPGLSQKLEIPVAPLATVSSEIKDKIPTDVIFVRSAGEKLDFNTNLSINKSGSLELETKALAGMPLHLVVKPSEPASQVKGYLVFKSREAGMEKFKQETLFNKILTPLSSLNKQLQLAEVDALSRYISLKGRDLPGIPEKSYQRIIAETSGKPEKRMVLLEFNYYDSGDGIYAADIQAPVVDGTYEVITRINYLDTTLPPKEISFITIVDPEGYVYEETLAGQIRIANAKVTLYWLEPIANQYKIWPAYDYNQNNPQTTNVRGTYAFLVPESNYYLTVEATGYDTFRGAAFEVKKGASGIHMDIELNKKSWYLNVFNIFKSWF